jgi:hypothetical protein
MVVERNSSQRSPETFYRDALPERYLGISLTDSEFHSTVAKVVSLLEVSAAPTHVQQALLFVLGGTDSRTLSLTIPTLVRFLDKNTSTASFEDGVSTLRRMLSSPEHVHRQASAILDGMQGIEKLDGAIATISAALKREGVVVLEKLRALLQ